MTSAAKLQRVLQLIFRQQALDAARKITPEVIDRGRSPDLHHWVAATATVIRPIMLEIFQSGLLHTAAKLGLKREPTLGPAAQAVLAASDRRYEIGNEQAFGELKRGLQGRGTVQTVDTAPLLHGRISAHFYPSLSSKAALTFKRQVFKAAGLGSTFDIFNPRVLDAVDAACMVLCRETLATATTDLTTALQRTRTALKEGLQRGEALASLAGEIQTIFASPARAQLIAVTESARAQNGGQLLAAADSGLVDEKEWVASANSCDQCLELDGKRVKLSEPFVVNGHGPYAVVMHGPLHPRCDCVVEYVFSGKRAA